MLLYLYSAFVLVVEVLQLIAGLLCYEADRIFHLFVGRSKKSIRGEVVLVTGAGHGMGRRLAEELAKLGAVMVLWDINEVNNKETACQIRKDGGQAFAYRCDVSDRKNVLEVADKVKKEIGEVNILVNNAGIMPCLPFTDYNPQQIERTMSINVMAHFWTLETFLPHMLETDHGHVVCLSSIAGKIGIPNLVPYCTSKFAVWGMMESLCREYHTSHPGVKFTTMQPYFVNTGLVKTAKVKRPGLADVMDEKYVVEKIVNAVLTEEENVTLPAVFDIAYKFGWLLPRKSQHLALDFVDSGVEPYYENNHNHVH